MPEHGSLQRKVLWTLLGLLSVFALIAVPLTMNNELRLRVAIQLGIAPGKDAEKIADGDDGTLLIVIPLDNDAVSSPTPWLYRAQFIAWPNQDGNRLENLETGAELQIPLTEITFIAANGDGSLILLRGPMADGSGDAAFTISPVSMELTQMASADAVPEVAGDWTTPTWEKTKGMCNRPSPNKRLVGCFDRAGTASYLAGDWQLDLLVWGDYEQQFPIMRGLGFLPWVGFAQDDSILYLQNEHGIWRIDVPEKILAKTTATEYVPATPVVIATPAT
ncbi:MAG: hypothetical protein KC435_01760 [Thermomicrobiales bacterium]|nr:hypothetical protein [Thermomicrobiales bacterium]